MSTINSSGETKERARRLAEQIGSNHISIDIDEAVSANVAIFAQVCANSMEAEGVWCPMSIGREVGGGRSLGSESTSYIIIQSLAKCNGLNQQNDPESLSESLKVQHLHTPRLH